MSAMTQMPLLPAQEEDHQSPTAVTRPNRRSLLADVERELKEHGRPYVAVNEAKKALFSAARLKAFHFCVYEKTEDNWLLWCGEATAEVRQNMAEWARVFGAGYQVVFAVRRKGGIEYRTSVGARLTLT